MKYCPNCKTQFPEESSFCSECGSALAVQPAESEPEAPAENTVKPKKNSTAAIVIISVLLVVIAVLVFFLFRAIEKRGNTDAPAAATTAAIADVTDTSKDAQTTEPPTVSPFKDDIGEYGQGELSEEQVDEFCKKISGHWVAPASIAGDAEEAYFSALAINGREYGSYFYVGEGDRGGEIQSVKKTDENTYTLTVYYEAEIFFEKPLPEDYADFVFTFSDGGKTLTKTDEDYTASVWQYAGKTMDEAKIFARKYMGQDYSFRNS